MATQETQLEKVTRERNELRAVLVRLLNEQGRVYSTIRKDEAVRDSHALLSRIGGRE